MLFLAVIIGFMVLLGLRLFPSVNEYLTIRKAVTHIMSSSPSSPTEIRDAFEKTSAIEYSIKTITSKDLNIQPLSDTGGFRTSFAYNVEVPIFEPMVFILMKYSGSASSGGIKGP
ncbi:MAG: DUF4845 domain-containing protein [Vitreoscilla sp.]